MGPGVFFSVILPTRNRIATLLRCLDALAHQTSDIAAMEVIVVDDGSADGTREELAGRTFPFALTVLRQGQGGPGSARNRGAAGARGEYLAFTEDDVVPDTRWLEHARRELLVSGADILEGKTVQAGTGADIRSFESVPRPSFIPCNLFVRRSLFERIGGYDAAFFDAGTGLYFREDSDFGFAALGQGARVVLARDVVVEHPAQFSDLTACMRHARRYFFDPLLYRKHPLLYRRMIEVKTIGRITVHRPQHYVATAYLLAVCGGVFTLLSGNWDLAAGSGLVALGLSTAVRFKYQGKRALRLHALRETAAFGVLPLVYLGSLVRGAVRFRSYGPLY